MYSTEEDRTVKKIFYGIYVFLVIAVMLAIMLGAPALAFFDLMLAVPPLWAALICAAIGLAIAAAGMSFICYVREFRRKHIGFNGRAPLIFREFMTVGISLITVSLGFLSFAGWRCLACWGGPP